MKKFKKNKIRFFTLLLASFTCFESCDLLDTQPAQSLDPSVALSSLEGLEGLAVSLQSRLRAEARYGRDLVLLPDVLADGVRLHPVPSGRYTGQSINQHGSHFGLWATAWNTINEANYIIDGIENIDNVPEDTRARLLGEALFHRAFAYHDLVKIYGYEPGREVNGWDLGVMIRLTPTNDLADADDRPRSTNVEVYETIQNDLEKAIGYLAQKNRGVFYPNEVAALTLMARVQLYLENWSSAVDYATQAMDATDVRLVSEAEYAANMYESEPNPESLFELKINPQTESLGSSDALDQYINPSGWFDVLPSNELIAAYDSDDVRLSLIKTHTDGSPYFTKFNGSAGTYTDNVPIFRYPELLLIRAEASAELGDASTAHEDLETLRVARGLDAYGSGNPAPTGGSLIDAVMNERRKEFAFEGHRWFDLKRRGLDIPKQGDIPTVSYTDYRILANIPNSEVNDPRFVNVKQNPGY